MQDVQYVVLVKPRADFGYSTSLSNESTYDVWVTYGLYYSLHEAKRVVEELVKKIDSDSIMLCKKVDKKMVLTLG